MPSFLCWHLLVRLSAELSCPVCHIFSCPDRPAEHFRPQPVVLIQLVPVVWPGQPCVCLGCRKNPFSYPLGLAPVAGRGGRFTRVIGLVVPMGKSLVVSAGGVLPPATVKLLL